MYTVPTDVKYDLEQRFTTGAVPLTSSGWEPGMLLNIYNAQDSPHTKNYLTRNISSDEA